MITVKRKLAVNHVNKIDKWKLQCAHQDASNHCATASELGSDLEETFEFPPRVDAFENHAQRDSRVNGLILTIKIA